VLNNNGMTGSLSLPYLNDMTELFGGQPVNIPEKIKLFNMPMTGFSYSTEKLPGDVTVAGAVRLMLSYECSEPFAQLASRIYEVKPDGKEVFVCRGWYEGYNPDIGKMTNTESQPIEMAACCHRFSSGSRIKLELETADITMTWPYPKASTIKLYHDWVMPSRILLPVVPNK